MSVLIHDNADNSPQEVALSGTGALDIALQVSPSSLNFAAAAIGSTAPYQQVTLTNNSSLNTYISSLNITDTTCPYSWGIREQNCEQTTLVPGGTCSFAVAFRPTSKGLLTADITIEQGLGLAQKVALTGTRK